MTVEKILIVDDEENIVRLVRMYLEQENFQTIDAKDGLAAIQMVNSQHPALMILDVMLPGMNGFEVCKKLRADNNNIPILILTAKDEDIDKILGLELGADDYLTKPFNPRELTARVKAILRRNIPLKDIDENPIHVGDIFIFPARREVWAGEVLIKLRTQEFEVLMVLARHPGIALTREQLLNLAWGFDFAGETRTVDVHVAQIRRKIANSNVRIETVTSIGYKLVS
jgi:two-component system alkaline phosphatase synthesis response regulator PhoP